jgi:hypothetical protein
MCRLPVVPYCDGDDDFQSDEEHDGSGLDVRIDATLAGMSFASYVDTIEEVKFRGRRG